jgi:hypothetical protein
MRKVALLSMMLAAACGSSGNGNGNPDMAVGGGGDGGNPMPDLATGGMVMNMGKQILPSVLLIGVTTDDQAVAITSSNGGVSAVAVAGGTPTVLDAKANQAVISGKVVFTWELASASVTTSDTLYVWKSGATPRKVTLVGATASSYALTGAATADGSYILYADNSVDGGATDVYVSKFDGTGAVKIATGADTNNMNCGVNGFGFGSRLFLFHCAVGAGGDAGTTGATLTVYDTGSGVKTDLSTDATTFGTDKLGNHGYFLDSTKQLWFVDLTAATPTPAKVTGGTAVNAAYISRDGTGIVWTNASGLSKAPVSGTPATVGTAVGPVPNIVDFLTSAPDDSSALVSDVVTDPMTFQSDITLLTSGGQATNLVTGGKGVLYGPAYSVDSKQVFYYDNPANPGVADLHTQPVAGGTKIDVSTKIWSHVVGATSKIAYNDNYKAGSSATANGKADIWIYDVATQMKTQISSAAVAAGAGGLYTSSDNKTLIYDYQPTTASQKGVYTYSLQ